MQYTAIPIDQLSAEQLETWGRLQQADSRLDSPYFRPEFAQAVAAVRSGSEVAVLEDAGRPVGFLPYHRTRTNVGLPIAGSMTDFQGAVVQPGVAWDVADLLRTCRLKALCFDHLLAEQSEFQRFHWCEATSPFVDLTHGFEAYRQQNKSRTLSGALQKMRKAERRVGPLRLESCITDCRVFQTLIAWKTNQYARTRVRNLFDTSWTLELLERVLTLRTAGLTGMLSALYLGDRLAAASLDMRSWGVLHVWFPAYDVELSQYSAGLLLLVRLAQEAQALGIQRIDLGKGPEEFKYHLLTGATTVAEGAADLRPLARTVRRWWAGLRDFARRSRWYRPARLVVRQASSLYRAGRAWWTRRSAVGPE